MDRRDLLKLALSSAAFAALDANPEQPITKDAYWKDRTLQQDGFIAVSSVFEDCRFVGAETDVMYLVNVTCHRCNFRDFRGRVISIRSIFDGCVGFKLYCDDCYDCVNVNGDGYGIHIGENPAKQRYAVDLRAVDFANNTSGMKKG